MLFSIVIPIYNVKDYLRQCLDSILNQSFSDYEVILVDDGSNDGSGDICDEYCKKNKNFIVIHKHNEGAGLARTTGLKIIKGKYVIFIDPDDIIEKDYLQSFVQDNIDDKFDTIINGYKEISESGEYILTNNVNVYTIEGEEVKNQLSPKSLGSKPELSDNIGFNIWARMYSASIIKDNNITIPSEREIGSEDKFFNYEYFKYAKKVLFSNKPGYCLRRRKNSLSTKYIDNRFDITINEVQELLKKVKDDHFSYESELRIMKSFFVDIKICFAQEERKISHKTFLEQRETLKKMLKNELIIKVLSEYPIHKLNNKQKVFVYLLKFRCLTILQLLIESGKFRIR